MEPVRLVIWDLDETFWKGTLTEGGIDQYVQEHHDIVVELAHRGIMSSICSKNDHRSVIEILQKYEIEKFFVFPSISWEPKGHRLKSLIESIQLRPGTVMFIDDNPSNRGEARALIPDLQVEDESFIPHMLSDIRFKGKDDRDLTRLTQYKLLETRKQDEASATGSNEDFLRGCNIRVIIDYDFGDIDNIDRAIELINRTNQLNYTKRRLPEDVEAARCVLRDEITKFHRQAGLVRVVDAYGDYGYVGFFLLETDVFRPLSDKAFALNFRNLLHFCFSCRTLGMLIEKWLYDYLGQPHLQVVGEVLTDLSTSRTVDWVTISSTLSTDLKMVEPVAPELRLYGGCEVYAIGVYLPTHSPKVELFGNFSSNGVFYRINSSVLALPALNYRGSAFEAETQVLSVPTYLATCNLFEDALPGTSFIFSGALDIQRRPHYRHKHFDWEFVFELVGCEDLDLTVASKAEITAKLAVVTQLTPAEIAHVAQVADHVRSNYQTTQGVDDHQRMSTMRSLIERVPNGSTFVISLDHDRLRLPDGTVRDDPPTTHYNTLMRKVADDYPYVATVCFSDLIESDDQIQIGGNHYDRIVYLKMAECLAQTIRTLPRKKGALAVMSIDRNIEATAPILKDSVDA